MIRRTAAITIAALWTISPATAATRTADAARGAGAQLSPMAQPIRNTLRPATLRQTTLRQTTLRQTMLGKSRYDLSRMMARNFGTIGQRQLDTLVASVL